MACVPSAVSAAFLVPARPRVSVAARRGVVPVRASVPDATDASSSAIPAIDVHPIVPRRVLGVSATAALFATSIAPSPARANDDDLEVVSETAGFGAKTAKTGDLVLVNYVATVGDDTLVDTTYGGEKFFTNGAQQSVQPAEPRPVIVRVNGIDPVPGQCAGLKRAVEGMRVGGVKTVRVAPAAGFGDAATRSPFALIPGGSVVTYEITVLRLSDTGPDALVKDVAGGGLGGANTMTNGCGGIVPAE